MNRKDFLQGLGLIGLTAAALPVVGSCNKDDDDNNNNGMAPNVQQVSCDTTPAKEEGPFPTHVPASYVTDDIRSDRTGVDLDIRIKIVNENNAGAPIADAIVDIWHCDRQGNYSEYGGTGMQSVNYTNVHFLRGRQSTNADGLVSFKTIFPGWYNGRTTHIHVHIYNAAGTSLLITQIGFPEGADSAVIAVNATSGYKGMNGYTYNAADHVFNDALACTIGTVTGNITDGYAIDHTIEFSI